MKFRFAFLSYLQAIRPKELIYNVKIGVDNGIENFFRVNTFNNKTYFPQQRAFVKRAKKSDEYCPVILDNSFDNSFFPPLLTRETELNIIATESCRTLKLNYDRDVVWQGFKGYRYTLSDVNTNKDCLDNSLGIKLPKGMFDASRCVSGKFLSKKFRYMKAAPHIIQYLSKIDSNKAVIKFATISKNRLYIPVNFFFLISCF